MANEPIETTVPVKTKTVKKKFFSCFKRDKRIKRKRYKYYNSRTFKSRKKGRKSFFK